MIKITLYFLLCVSRSGIVEICTAAMKGSLQFNYTLHHYISGGTFRNAELALICTWYLLVYLSRYLSQETAK